MTYAKEGDDGLADRHIVVFRNNHPWRVDVVQGGRILSTAEIQK